MARKLTRVNSPRSGGEIPDFTINQFLGLVTSVKNSKELAKGSASESSNWLTSREKDHIELRRGYTLLGQTRNDGAGKITGLGVANDVNQSQMPFFTYGQTLAYYSLADDDTHIVSATQFPAAASGDDFSIQAYENLAGYFCYISSPNSGAYKIPVANPASVVDLKQNVFKGNFQIKHNRTIMWNKRSTQTAGSQATPSGAGQWDKTGYYLSYIDRTALGSYTFVGAEAGGAGNGVTLAFSSTLAAIAAATTPKTAFAVEIGAIVVAPVNIATITLANPTVITTSTPHGLAVGDVVICQGVTGTTNLNNLFLTVLAVPDPSTVNLGYDATGSTAFAGAGVIGKAEYFLDDRNGNLSSNLGGTGTINYATGAYSVTFNTAPVNTYTLALGYYTEDSTTHGIWDFSYSGTRTAGQGNYFRQDEGGGNAMGAADINGILYCPHQYKTWALALTDDDTNASNLPYRAGIGVPFMRAFDETGSGVPLLNFSDVSNPYLEQLEAILGATGQYSIVPKTLSSALDLSLNGFDYPVVKEWSDYLMLECQSMTANGVNQGFNDTMYLMNRFSKQWDKLSLYATALAAFNGTLLAGDSLTNNIYQLFTGFTDDGAVIPNYWISSEVNLAVEGRKRFYRFVFDGLMSVSQVLEFYISFDGGPFVLLYTQTGTDPNVDFNNPVTIGATMIGTRPIGDGSPSGGAINAYHFRKEVTNSDSSILASPVFEWARLKVVATNIGWAQINELTFKDIRSKGRRVSSKYIGSET